MTKNASNQPFRWSSTARLLGILGPPAILLCVMYVYWPSVTPPGGGFAIPENASAFLVWRDNITGEEKQLPIEAQPGQTLYMWIGEQQEDARTLDDLRDDTLHPIQPSADAAEAWKQHLARGYGITVTEDALLPSGGSRFTFHYMTSSHPLMELLREREELDEVVADTTAEFEKFEQLLMWVRSQLTEGVPNPYPPFNAPVILNMTRAGKTQAFCGQYAQVFVQCLISLGYQARYVGLKAHEVMEVWSNEHAKWVLMDPYNGWYFRQAETPLSTLEVHQLVCEKRTVELEVVRLDPGVTRDLQTQLEQYETFNVSMVNNHPELGGNGIADVNAMWHRRVYWVDQYTGASPNADGRLRMLTSTPSDIYFNINTVFARLDPEARGLVNVRLHTLTPELDRIEYRLDDEEWEACETAFPWVLVPGENRMELRAITTADIIGPTSRVVLTYED